MNEQTSWTVGRLLNWTTEYLTRHGVDSPRLDAEVLLAHARQCSRIQLYTEFAEPADDHLREAFRRLVKQRSQGTPVAYLVGHREFYSLDFEVSRDVLIPRPETEFVVISLLDLVKQHQLGQQPLRIADVGTGSGILAVCVARHLPTAQVWAIDMSQPALEIARRNARRHAVDDRVTLVCGNLLTKLPANEPLDFVVSNPPYVSESEWDELPAEVRQYEPRGALVGGPHGDEIIRQLIDQSAIRLRPGGWLVLEISPMLHTRMAEWFEPLSQFEPPRTVPDLAQLPRVVIAGKRLTADDGAHLGPSPGMVGS